jgi:hypothetical protein
LTKTDPLQIWLGEVGPIAGRLRWAKRGSVGIVFDLPLDEGEVATIKQSAAPAAQAEVIQLRRRLHIGD